MKATMTAFMMCLITMALSAQDLTLIQGLNGKFGFKDDAGKIIVPPKYDNSGWFREGMARVAVADEYGFVEKWGFIDGTGKEITPMKYDLAYDFSEGLAAVNIGASASLPLGPKEGGRWGFIDKTGKEVVPFKYESVKSFSGGKAEVVHDGISYTIDKNNLDSLVATFDKVKKPDATTLPVFLGDSRTQVRNLLGDPTFTGDNYDSYWNRGLVTNYNSAGYVTLVRIADFDVRYEGKICGMSLNDNISNCIAQWGNYQELKKETGINVDEAIWKFKDYELHVVFYNKSIKNKHAQHEKGEIYTIDISL